MPRQGAALLRTLGSEVCDTEVRLWHGQPAGVPYPIIPGNVVTFLAVRKDM